MNIAIVGYGNVGRAVAELLVQRREWLRSICNEELRIVGVSDRSGVLINHDGLDLTSLAAIKERGKSLATAGAIAATPPEIIDLFVRADVQAVIETLPSGLQTRGEPAISIITEALQRSLHVVTANKAVLLFAGPKLEKLAAEKGVRLGHSGATCAALPTLSFARRELVGARITAIRGILNGTTNYILTRMHEDGANYADALAEAQHKGIAEPDPTYDVAGYDSAVKLVILTNALMQAKAGLDDVARMGIDDLPSSLLEAAHSAGGTIRLIASAQWQEGQVMLSVRPQIVLPTDSLFAVCGSNKAVEFQTDLYGTLLIAGGASSRLAVAMTMLKDLLAAVG